MENVVKHSLILASMMVLAVPAEAQEDSLPPASIRAPNPTVDAVLAPVRALFVGIAAHDPEVILPHIVEGATISIADSRAGANQPVRTVAFSDWLAQLSSATEQYEERMPNPVVDIDGDIAMVWGFYTFHRNSAFSHCGADHFSLVREESGWKIANLAFSMRATDCGE